MITELKKYQKRGARMIYDFGGRVLEADEMGLGKTLIVLYYAYKLKSKRPLVIVCPASLTINWQREAMNHLGLFSDILKGRPPKLNARGFGRYHSPILIISYDILHKWVDYLVGLSPQMIYWDEAHYVSNRETRRFTSLEDLIKRADIKRRIAISGTPLTNRPAELWTTLHLLWPDEFPSYIEFGQLYCKPKWVRGKLQFHGAKNLPELHGRLLKLGMVRRLKNDVAKELPTKSRHIIPVEIEDRAEYDLANKDFPKWMKMRHPTKYYRAMKAPKLTKIGYMLRLVARLKRFKTRDWIADFLQNSDEKLVVFSGHRKLIEWLHKKYPDTSVVIQGGMSSKHRQAAVDNFQKLKRIRIAFCNPKAAGVGITLNSASNVLYADFPWAPGTLKQGEDRVHRIGQTKLCFIWFLAAVDTIEERLLSLLKDKQDILDKVLDGQATGKDFEIFDQLLKAA